MHTRLRWAPHVSPPQLMHGSSVRAWQCEVRECELSCLAACVHRRVHTAAAAQQHTHTCHPVLQSKQPQPGRQHTTYTTPDNTETQTPQTPNLATLLGKCSDACRTHASHHITRQTAAYKLTQKNSCKTLQHAIAPARNSFLTGP